MALFQQPHPQPSAAATAALGSRSLEEAPAWQALHPADPGQGPLAGDLRLDRSRDKLLTAFGKATLRDRYLLPGEGYQDLFARVACAFADDTAHAQRLYDAMSRLWFMPATPILANGGTRRGLPISCFLNAVPDSIDGIFSTWTENAQMAASGGGIGSYWGDVRSIGEAISKGGRSGGIMPYLHAMDGLALAVNQGATRQGSAAAYLDVHHPEIEEFLDSRKPSGDMNRKCLNLHQGVNLTDAFMRAVRDGARFALRSPHDGKVLREVDARRLWQRILETRLQTGEPFLLFIDTVNAALAPCQKQLGLKVLASNLCSEIVLPTGRDHRGRQRSAVCCLASMNLATWGEWREREGLIEDVLRMLDNVLTHFIEKAPDRLAQARYAAARERSVGLGVMGFHSALQAQGIALEEDRAKAWNREVFRHLRSQADRASAKLAAERGPCPDAAEQGLQERFAHKLAIAPTASISIICGGVSAGVEPFPANIYTHKTLSGAFSVRNPQLLALLRRKGKDLPEIWQSILEHQGSVQHLDCLSPREKAVFRTAFEVDQYRLLVLGAERTPFICQSQSLNLFLDSQVDRWDLHMLHWTAWRSGIKSLYYCRSKAAQRPGFAGLADNSRPSVAGQCRRHGSGEEGGDCEACQ